MLRAALRRFTDFFTDHTRITLLDMAVLTALVLAGIPMLDTGSQAGGTAEDFQDVERVQKAQYVQEHYGAAGAQSNRTLATVYVRDDDGNVLSKSALLEELRYQREVSENESLQAALHDDGMVGLSNLVARQASDETNPDLATQIEALEASSDAEVERLVERTLANDPRALRFLPADHDPGSTPGVARLPSSTGARSNGRRPGSSRSASTYSPTIRTTRSRT